MPYQIKVDGMRELSDMLSRMEERAPAVASKALYDGAGVMSKALEEGTKTIKTAPFRYARDGETRLPSPEELAVVNRAHVGIAKFEKNGTDTNTSVGYANAGYTKMAGKTVAIPKIVNAINSGTSFMQKQPFVRKASRAGEPKAVKAMKDVIEAEFSAMQQTK